MEPVERRARLAPLLVNREGIVSNRHQKVDNTPLNRPRGTGAAKCESQRLTQILHILVTSNCPKACLLNLPAS